MSECTKCVEEGNWPLCNKFVAAAFKKNQCQTCFHPPSSHGISGVNEAPVKKAIPPPKTAPTTSVRKEQPKEEPKPKPKAKEQPKETPKPKVQEKPKVVEEEIVEEEEIIDDGEVIEEEPIEEPKKAFSRHSGPKTESVPSGKMRAVVKKGDGGAEVLNMGIVDKPKPSKKEVLIKVMAAGVNRADTLQRQGKYPPPKGASEIIGLEVAGTVEEVGADFEDLWKKGDRVCGLVAGGGYAQYCVVHGDMLMEVPDEMSFETAAGIPEAFLTAYQLLYFYGGLRDKVTQSGQTILIHAGASGIGTSAIQLSKIFDNTVIVTTSSSDKMELCKKLGSDHQINYKSKNWEKEVSNITKGRGVDILIDCVGASNFTSNVNSMAQDGRLILYGLLSGSKVDNFDISTILKKRLSIHGSTLRDRDELYKVVLCQEFFEKTQDLFETGKLAPVIDKTFSIEDAKSAHEYMEANKTMGKVILTVNHD